MNIVELANKAETYSELLRTFQASGIAGQLRAGDCVEVHFLDGEKGQCFGPRKVSEFINEWAYMTPELRKAIASPRAKWLAICHESGQLLLRLDR